MANLQTALLLPYQKLPDSLLCDPVFMANWYPHHMKTIIDDPSKYIGPDYQRILGSPCRLWFLDNQLMLIQGLAEAPIKNGLPHGVVKSATGYLTFYQGILHGPFDLKYGQQRRIGYFDNGIQNVTQTIQL